MIDKFKILTSDEKKNIKSPTDSLVKVVFQNRKISKYRIKKRHQVMVEGDFNVEFLGVLTTFSYNNRPSTIIDSSIVNPEENPLIVYQQ